jgi:hypothetical protein
VARGEEVEKRETSRETTGADATGRAAIFLKREMESQIAMMECNNMSGTNDLMRGLKEREKHARGVRRRGCPCCDPDDPDNVIDMMMNI